MGGIIGGALATLLWVASSSFLLPLQIVTLAPTRAFVLFSSSYAAFSRQYEIGTRYSFNYETSVLLNEPQTPPVVSKKDVGFKLNLLVTLDPIWQNPSSNEQLLELKISSPKLSVKARREPSPEGFVARVSKAEELQDFPFFILRKDGAVEKVLFTDKEPLSWVNIKKGIASLFQYRPKDSDETETDSSGECSILYRTKGQQLVHKIKTECKSVEHPSSFSHVDKVWSAQITSQRETTYEFEHGDGAIKSCTSVEIHTLRPEMKPTAGAEVMSKQVLYSNGRSESKGEPYTENSVSEVVQKISKERKWSLVSDGLQTKPEPKECIACKSLNDLIQNFQKALSSSSLGTQSAAIAYLRLLGKMRDSDEKTIKGVLKNMKYKNILPQLLDIVAGTQTMAAHSAARSVLNFEGNIDLPERYLFSLSVATHPPEFIIEDLFKLHKKNIVRDSRLRETLLLTIASMTKTFASQKNSNQKIILDVRKNILTNLESCESEECWLVHIRALKNLKDQWTIPTLIKFAKGPSKKLAVAAMRAIQTMPKFYIESKTLKHLEDILFETDAPHDTSVRAMASEVLLRWPPKETILRDIFTLVLGVQDNRTKELNTIILGHIFDLCEKNPLMDEMVRKILNVNSLWNYHILSQNGLSSAFSRSLIKDDNANSSITNMIEIQSGILKRAFIDVFIDVDDERISLLSFGMFAGGLSMFGGDDVEDDGEEANAGLEIAKQGSQLRPFVFFQTQGELMGHVFSGTASSRTTVLQGTVLLQDHSQIIPLQNGLNAELILTGSCSFDFAGQVEISVWYRNARSLVEIGASGVMQGQARVDNSFIQTMVEFNVGSQTQVNLNSDLESQPTYMMCLKMHHPDMEVIENVRKFERIPGSNYVLRKYKRKSSTVTGKTYVMNKKNTEICNLMHQTLGD